MLGEMRAQAAAYSPVNYRYLGRQQKPVKARTSESDLRTKTATFGCTHNNLVQHGTNTRTLLYEGSKGERLGQCFPVKQQ
ncbi:hypothetical protein Y032_0850g2682 [Ancylostoma ceylanicum]|uniref:Uncharacterized protein n=1 Tax=Ancylostoma ceylanicum TaxID=53326 RepID=A0A016WB40_9BILA|nr:hypothetical protein Y032_0850g2682 [Ancylostoma ceylanicum]